MLSDRDQGFVDVLLAVGSFDRACELLAIDGDERRAIAKRVTSPGELADAIAARRDGHAAAVALTPQRLQSMWFELYARAQAAGVLAVAAKCLEVISQHAGFVSRSAVRRQVALSLDELRTMSSEELAALRARLESGAEELVLQ